MRTLVGRDKYQQYTLHVAHWLRINKRLLCGRTESGRLITGGFHRNDQYNRSGQVSVVRKRLTLFVFFVCCCFFFLFGFLSFHVSVVVFLVSFLLCSFILPVATHDTHVGMSLTNNPHSIDHDKVAQLNRVSVYTHRGLTEGRERQLGASTQTALPNSGSDSQNRAMTSSHDHPGEAAEWSKRGVQFRTLLPQCVNARMTVA